MREVLEGVYRLKLWMKRKQMRNRGRIGNHLYAIVGLPRRNDVLLPPAQSVIRGSGLHKNILESINHMLGQRVPISGPDSYILRRKYNDTISISRTRRLVGNRAEENVK